MAELNFTDKRVCGHCGNRAPMVIVGEYREKKYDMIDSQIPACEYGEWYHLLKCQSCEKVELRVHSYHLGISEEECPYIYNTLYPVAVHIPEGLPKKVKDEYQRALKARHGDSNGYGVLLGRVLEAVFHDKKAKGKMLGQQLQDMANRNQLPLETLAFAAKLNNLRIVGAHFNKGKLTQKEIPIMERLTKAILEYVYSAPHIMKQAEKAVRKIDNKMEKKPNELLASPLKKISLVPPIRRLLINEVPYGHFHEVSIEMPKWESYFAKLIANEKMIKYDIYHMPTIGSKIRRALLDNRYTNLILKSDPDQHFLVPKGYGLRKYLPAPIAENKSTQ